MTAENYGPERTFIFLLSENVAVPPQAEDFGGYLPNLMAVSAKHLSHFFPSAVPDMLNVSLCQAR